LDDETSIPALKGVRGGDRRDILQVFPVDWVRQHGQAALGIGEAKWSSLELRFQDAIFFMQVDDDMILVVMEPDCEPGNQEL
jgi:hypothetical protein